MKEMSITSPAKIVLLVIDGLGGLPHDSSCKTELESASTPNMDKLASLGNCGLLQTVGTGITPGSAPGHLGLFGYDPLVFTIGRGVLEALGMDFDLKPGDIAARGNFCTLDEKGLISDRRAGRISTENCKKLCRLLDGMEIDGVRVIVQAVKEHRLVAIFRGEGLCDELSDADPQQLGVLPKQVTALAPGAELTAKVVNQFLTQARLRLAAHHPANMVLLRGFSRKPNFPSMAEIYKLKAAAIASYPMYRGLAKVVGMDVLKTGMEIVEEVETLEQDWKSEHNFYFFHVKKTDSYGEDGNFDGRVHKIEEVDALIPRIIALKPDVFAVTGDHSTPAVFKAHTWHPVPALIWGNSVRRDGVGTFGEKAAICGGMGRFDGAGLMLELLAHAGKMKKMGA